MFCPACGQQVADDQVFCHHCGTRISDADGSETAGDVRTPTPWENREHVGYFGGLFATLKEVLFRPAGFFRFMPVKGGLVDPLLYALIVGMAGIMAFYFWDSLFHDSVQTFMSQEMHITAGEHDLFRTVGTFLTAVMAPFVLILWIFIVAGVLYAVLLMVRGANAGFEATFRVVSYGMSPFILLIIPFCGTPIAGLWVIFLFVIGLREAHKTTGGKAAFAVFFPFLFCCGMAVLFITLLMGALAASFGAMMHSYR